MNDPPNDTKPLAWITGAAGLIGSHIVRTAAVHAPNWRVRGLTRSDFDLTDFPRDAQDCEWKIGSWAYGSDQLKLVPLEDPKKKYLLDWSNFMPNEEWDLGIGKLK